MEINATFWENNLAMPMKSPSVFTSRDPALPLEGTLQRENLYVRNAHCILLNPSVQEEMLGKLRSRHLVKYYIPIQSNRNKEPGLSSLHY